MGLWYGVKPHEGPVDPLHSNYIMFLQYKLYYIMISATYRLWLKGHGNEADFLGFLQKLVPHESLTLPFEPFQFLLRIHGDIRV